MITQGREGSWRSHTPSDPYCLGRQDVRGVVIGQVITIPLARSVVQMCSRLKGSSILEQTTVLSEKSDVAIYYRPWYERERVTYCMTW